METRQPVAFTIGSPARTLSQATGELLQMAETILQPEPHQALVLADNEHLSWTSVLNNSGVKLITP